MSNILQTYHATSDGSRGLHAFTTPEAFDALALANAIQLRAELGEFLNWSNLVLESVAATHGEGKVTAAIRDRLARLEAVYSQAGG